MVVARPSFVVGRPGVVHAVRQGVAARIRSSKPPRRRRHRGRRVMAGIPEGSLLTAVRGYASDAVGCSPDRITAVSRFEDGNRHAVYKVSYLDAVGATKDLVIRGSYGGDPADCAQAEREASVLKKAGGIAAPLLYDFRCTGPVVRHAGHVHAVRSRAPTRTELSGASGDRDEASEESRPP